MVETTLPMRSTPMLAYQLPDAPPPPKLPPPPENPPLSLELLPENEPPPPDQPVRPPDDAKLPPNKVKTKAMAAAIKDSASDPRMSHASNPTMPPAAAEPTSLPSTIRRKPLSAITPKMMKGNASPTLSGKLQLCCGCGAGSGSPLMTATIRATPAVIPPAKSPFLNFGTMISSMMRLAVTSVERALEAVADLDAQVTVVLGDNKQGAVVDLLAPDLPGFGDPDRILLDRLGRRGRDDQHRDLAAFARVSRSLRVCVSEDMSSADSVPV